MEAHAVDDILTWQTGLFALGIFVFSLFIRRGLEAVFPTLRKDTPLSRWQLVWEKLVLPSVPVVVGMLLAVCVKSYPYPELLSTAGSRAIYGAVCGFFSSWAYKVLKAALVERFRIDLEKETDSIRPPSVAS